MRLEDLSIVTRPRSHYEAMDLGFTMVRHWWRSAYMAWLLASLPVFVAACVLLHESPEYIPLVSWWFKPYYDRLVLQVLGARVFGAKLTFVDLLRFIPRTFRLDLLWHLTVRRYDLSRSLRLPVLILEGLKGKQYRTRYRLLCQNVLGRAQWLSIACVSLEQCLTLGLIGVLYLFIPPSVELDLEELWHAAPAWIWYAFAATYYLAMSMIEPAYVAGGFALYLNRRTLLEGWDLELGLRRMARRLESRKIAGVTALVCAALALGVLYAAPAKVMAVDAAQGERDPNWVAEPRPAGDAREVAGEVLADKDFETKRTVTQWFDFPDWDFDEPDEKPDQSSNGFMLLAAQIIELLMWIVVIAGAAWLIYKLTPLARSVRVKPLAAEVSQPLIQSGETPRSVGVGANVTQRALEYQRNGDLRGALSLLYRGAIEQLDARHRLTVPDGATERDLLALARSRA
ncbi:MAG: hypothetical protein ACR2RL_26035, partial [Gammaproteobacteria bacterium]